MISSPILSMTIRIVSWWQARSAVPAMKLTALGTAAGAELERTLGRIERSEMWFQAVGWGNQKILNGQNYKGVLRWPKWVVTTPKMGRKTSQMVTVISGQALRPVEINFPLA